MLTALLNEIVTLPDEVVLVLDDYHADRRRAGRPSPRLPARAPAAAAAPGHRHPRGPAAAPGPAARPGPVDRAARRRPAVHPRRSRRLPQRGDGAGPLGGRTSPPWRRAPRAGSPACNWRRSRCRGTRTCPGSSGRSPATTATSWTIWSTRSCSASPTPVRDFLLQTAILDRLNGPLCDAVTGQEDGSARLEALERGNLFVVPLDDKRHWYRYHHLFADVLRAHLLEEQPEQVATLHRRASAWYEQHGSLADAIRHALAAGDVARAADLVERALPAHAPESAGGHVARLAQGAPRRGDPPPARAQRCVCLGAAGQRRARGRRGPAAGRRTVAGHRRRAGAGRPEAPAAEMVVVDDEEFRRLPA